MSVRVVAPCRLHFGLFHVPVDGLTQYPDGRPVRKFGGLGLMIEEPCVTVTATETEADSVTGSLAERVTEFLFQVREEPPIAQRYLFRADGPSEHTGLGIGTALLLALSYLILRTISRVPITISEPSRLARYAQRGLRSGIGVNGFGGGGFISDAGKTSDGEQVSRCQRSDFPPDWRIILVRAPAPPVWFGDRERTAFARTRPADRALALTDRLRMLAYNTIVPAVRDANFDTFAQSIYEFNRLAGEPFHDDQGGAYASPEVACVIDELQEMGAVGVGQSSWGPTVFAFARDADEAEHLAKRARGRFSSTTEVIVTAANNTGARLTSTDGHADQPHQ